MEHSLRKKNTTEYSESRRNFIADKRRLLVRFNYVSSLLSIIFGFFSIYVMNITTQIPHIFFSFAVVNFTNTVIFKKHDSLYVMAIITSILSLIATLLISIFSGGINSPFMFILAIIVLAGYLTTRKFGQIYLLCILGVITVVFLASYSYPEAFTNVVPNESKSIFSYVTMLFSVYVLGGIFGSNLLKTHHNLYKTKKAVESKIKEKETLLKEVHHRVKNNLQTVSSLLSMQARNTDDDSVKNLFKSSQNRVIAMAMVHEMLYTREDISKIEYKTYVQDLAEHLIRSIKGKSNNISLTLDFLDVKLNIDTAIPLGLLINEVVTNALKYGIVGESKGEILIKLRGNPNEDYLLNIGDNGTGFAETITHKNSKSLGLKLINNLARQLRGSIKRDLSKKGTHYIVNFKEVQEQVDRIT